MYMKSKISCKNSKIF